MQQFVLGLYIFKVLLFVAILSPKLSPFETQFNLTDVKFVIYDRFQHNLETNEGTYETRRAYWHK